MKTRTIPWFLVALLLVAVDTVWARSGPYYSYIEIYADGGGVTSGGLQGPQSDPAIFALESAEGVVPISLADGAPWFCNTPGCSVSIGSYAGLGWAEAEADAAGSLLGLRTGAFQAAGPVPDNCTPWGCFPVQTWGSASAYGYVSRLVRVESDGTLNPGGAVDVRASASLAGAFTDDLYTSRNPPVEVPAGRLHAALFMSRINDRADPLSYWNSGSHLSYGGVLDMLADPDLFAESRLGHVQYRTDSLATDPVGASVPVSETLTLDIIGSSLADPLQVGDLLLFEATLYVETMLENDEGGHVAWSEFGDTMTANLVPLTAGARLSSVPLPPAWLLLAPAAASLLALRRRG